MIRLKLLLTVLLLTPWLLEAQKVKSFNGIDALQLSAPPLDIDPNGAVGTKQYLEWVNNYYQGYDKVTFAPVWSAVQNGATPFLENNMPNCKIAGDGLVLFDRMALRWIIAGHTGLVGGKYYYCVAISNTDDLAATNFSWYTYQFLLNPVIGVNSGGRVYYPDWPKLGTWPDAYYVSMDLEDPSNNYLEIGVVVCALDRANMLIGSTANPMQCFSDPSPIPHDGTLYLSHSLIPADVDGPTAPPQGRDEFLVSIQNPTHDGHTTKSNSINLWEFHVDWINPANSTLTKSSLSMPPYTPGCYNLSNIFYTFCVPQSSFEKSGVHYHIDSVGDRLMPRLAYRNFGTYESFLGSQTVRVGTGGNKQTAIRWFELRGSGVPTVFQTGTVNPDTLAFRFMPSIAQDRVGNAAVGYSVSDGFKIHPGIRASWWNLSHNTAPTEVSIAIGKGDEENSMKYGDYTSMTVDPVDGCTFWYVNEFFPTNQTGGAITWNTKIAKFKLSTCH
jgi:hypothetical protein